MLYRNPDTNKVTKIVSIEYLESGEIQTLETLIKCIVVSSGNDASVAVAEYIAGTEADFVEMTDENTAKFKIRSEYLENEIFYAEDQPILYTEFSIVKHLDSTIK